MVSDRAEAKTRLRGVALVCDPTRRLMAGTISGPALTSTSTSLPSRARARMSSKRHGRSFAHSFPFQLPTSRSFTSSQVQSAQRLSMPAMRFRVGSWKLKTRPSRVR